MPIQFIEVEVELMAMTDKAVLCRLLNHDDEETWIPWSQIEDNDEDLERGHIGVVYVSEWFARKEGIEA